MGRLQAGVQAFKTHDLNNDGVLDKEELRLLLKAARVRASTMPAGPGVLIHSDS